MNPKNHQLELIEKFFEENFNELDQLGLWKQVQEYSTFKVEQLVEILHRKE